MNNSRRYLLTLGKKIPKEKMEGGYISPFHLFFRRFFLRSGSNYSRGVGIIFGLYFVLAFGYSILMPIWEAPDETAHYHLAWSIARKGEFPSIKKNYEAHQPRPYYYIASTVITLLDKINPRYSDYYLPTIYKYNLRVRAPRHEWNAETYRLLWGVYVLRWVNILFGGGALWFIWRAFKIILPDKPSLQISALALAALTPQFLHIMAAVSNDPFGTLAGAILFYWLLKFREGQSLTSGLILMVAAVSFPLLTKLTVLPVGLAVLLVFGWQIVRRYSRKQQFLIGLGILVAISAITLGMYLFSRTALELVINEIVWRAMSFRPGAFTLKYLGKISGQLIWSYWGWVGWLAVGLPIWMVVVLTGLSLVGFIFSTKELIKSEITTSTILMRITWLIAVLTIFAVFKNGLTTIASQGRFLFPAIGPLSLLFVGGWYERLPEKWRNYLPLIVTLFMLLCNLVLWQFGVIPVYYQPFLD